MSKAEKRADYAMWRYAMWRFDMWIRGYGSYRAIDEAVSRGELEAGKRYPDKLEPVAQPAGAKDGIDGNG